MQKESGTSPRTVEHSRATVEKLLYDRKGAAFALSICVRALDYELARGEFETRRIGRKRLITASSPVELG